MKNKGILYIFIVIGALFFVASFFKTDVGEPADWLQGVGTVGALLFAYQEIIDSKEQFNQEHKPKLRVYITWNEPLILDKKRTGAKDKSRNVSVVRRPVAKLHIVPVNIGLSSGIYRYFGISKKDDLPQIKKLMRKASDGQLGEVGVNKIASMIYYDCGDVGDTESEHDLTGMDLIYPKNRKIFQTIKPNSVGKILDKPIRKIQDKLHVRVQKGKIEVLFTDPQMKIYSFEFRPLEKEKSSVSIEIPSENN